VMWEIRRADDQIPVAVERS